MCISVDMLLSVCPAVWPPVSDLDCHHGHIIDSRQAIWEVLFILRFCLLIHHFEKQ